MTHIGRNTSRRQRIDTDSVPVLPASHADPFGAWFKKHRKDWPDPDSKHLPRGEARAFGAWYGRLAAKATEYVAVPVVGDDRWQPIITCLAAGNDWTEDLEHLPGDPVWLAPFPASGPELSHRHDYRPEYRRFTRKGETLVLDRMRYMAQPAKHPADALVVAWSALVATPFRMYGHLVALFADLEVPGEVSNGQPEPIERVRPGESLAELAERLKRYQ